MNPRIKKRIINNLYNSNKNDKEKFLLKHLKKKPAIKKLISSTNTINLSINPPNSKIYALSVKKSKNYKTSDSTLIKINQSINTVNSFNYNNKNSENYKNYEINDLNIATIHSNGKFNNIKHLRNNIRKRLYEKNIILSK